MSPMSNHKPKKLVEGLDYYMEGDKFVFTAHYHLKRGYCCNSKCRHCPYGLAPDAGSTIISIVGLPSGLPPTDK